MKKLIVLSGAIALFFSACTSIGSSSMKTEEDTLAYCLGTDMGTYIYNVDSMLGEKLNADLLITGIKNAIKKDTSIMTTKDAYDFMRRYYSVIKPRKDSIASAEFLAKVEKENKNVQKTESGLLYEVIEIGDSNVKADSTSKVRVLYRMADRNGNDIQNTYDSNDTLDIPIKNVIKGFAEGMTLVGKGGKIKLWIPAELGYGSRQQGPIPANSALYYEVDVIDVVPAEEPAKK